MFTAYNILSTKHTLIKTNSHVNKRTTDLYDF